MNVNDKIALAIGTAVLGKMIAEAQLEAALAKIAELEPKTETAVESDAVRRADPVDAPSGATG